MNVMDSATGRVIRGNKRRAAGGTTIRASFAAIIGVLCVTGCSGASTSIPTRDSATEPATGSTQTTGPTTTSTPTSPNPSAPTTSPSIQGLPSFGSVTKPVDGGYGSGNGLGLLDVRTARRRGYDRVTFVLAGRGTPGFYVAYVRDPRLDGSGDRVDLKGTIALQVILRGMGLPQDTGIKPFADITTRVSGQGTSGVAEIAPGGTFEGDQGAYVGLTGIRRPFRAFVLTDPTRIVVDVRHRWDADVR